MTTRSPRPILKRAASDTDIPPLSPELRALDGSDLLNIDRSVLGSLVRFSPSASLTRTYETHSSDAYDRSPMRKRSNTYSGSAREGCTNPCKDLTERMVAPRPSLRLSRTESLVGLQIVEEPEEDGQGSSLADGCPNSSGTSGDISKPLDPCQPMTRQDVLTGRIFWASDSRRFGRSRPSRIRWQVQESTASSASVTEEKAVPADFSQPASSDST